MKQEIELKLWGGFLIFRIFFIQFWVGAYKIADYVESVV